MRGAMRLLIAVSGSEPEDFFQRIAVLTPLDRAERVILVHVIDEGPRHDLEFGRERLLHHHPLPPHRSQQLAAAEAERARSVLQFAHSVLRDADVPESILWEETLHGKPKEEILRLAERERVDLIVVGAHPDRIGPHSLGKTARFLLDHAPRAALLIR